MARKNTIVYPNETRGYWHGVKWSNQRATFAEVSGKAQTACEGVEDKQEPKDFERCAMNAAAMIRLTKAEIRKGNADSAARWAFLAGMEWQFSRVAWLYSDDIQRAERWFAGLADAANKTNARHVSLRDKRFAVVAELVTKVGPEEAARRCAKIEGMGKASTIKKQWNRRKKRRDT